MSLDTIDYDHLRFFNFHIVLNFENIRKSFVIICTMAPAIITVSYKINRLRERCLYVLSIIITNHQVSSVAQKAFLFLVLKSGILYLVN